MKTFIYTVFFALALVAGTAYNVSAEVITPSGPFSGTYKNAPAEENAYYIATIDQSGNCRTIQVNATSLTQAIQIAQGYCPGCSVTDVTGEYRPGYESFSPPPAEYCPLK